MSLRVMGICATWLVLLFQSGYGLGNSPPKVIITAGGSSVSRAEIGKALTAILQTTNRVARGEGSLDEVEEYFTETGFSSFVELVETTGMYTTVAEYRTHLLETAQNDYEIRGIKVRVKMGSTQGDPLQELVFVCNARLFVENVHFALEEHHYKRLIEEGAALDDLIYREQILDFLEDFRTAHNTKNLDYLEKAYSDSALIIVGRVLQEQEHPDLLESSKLGEEKIQFIKLKKQEYLDRLRQVFKLNSFVKVIFDKIEIVRHSKYDDIYGIKLKQRWNSSTYSDEGFLFVMMDFKDPERPLIHVRSWQPEKFADGTVVGLGDFEIIE